MKKDSEDDTMGLLQYDTNIFNKNKNNLYSEKNNSASAFTQDQITSGCDGTILIFKKIYILIARK